MKKVAIISLVIASVFVSGCSISGIGKNKGDTVLSDEARMQRDAMIQDAKMNNPLLQKDDMMKKEDVKKEDLPAGSYAAYSEEAVKAALVAKKNVVLFFHATWCPTCKAADENFSKETPIANMAVFRVDYDTNTELRQKYGVTSQHTYVALNADGSIKKKSSGTTHFLGLTDLFPVNQ